MKTKTTTLRHLLVTIAAIGAALIPINILAAPGDLFVSDPYAGTISKFTPDGTKTTFASKLPYATGLAFDASGNLFVDVLLPGGDGATILKFTPDGTKSTFAQTGLRGGGSLAFDDAGNLFVADEISGTIFKFTPGGTKSTFASGLHTPIGLAFDSSGNLFVADNGFGAIVKFTPDGTRTTFAAGLTSPWGLGFGASGDLFQISNPYGDSDGGIYVFTPGGTPKSIFASGLNQPTFLAFDAAGNLFVAAAGTIFKFTPDGTKSTFASGVTNVQGLAFEPAIPTPGATLRNISTRASVQTDSGVTIGGFIITGTGPKTVVVRGLGPTLTNFNVTGVLADPTLGLYNGSGSPIFSNNNWKDSQQAAIQATGLAPSFDVESAILITLQPGNYTATLAGKNGTTGVGLVEVYDTSTGALAELTNVSSRGFVGTDQNVMIAGFIASGSIQVVVRGLGPTLAQFGLSGTLADPMVTLVDSNGNVLQTNNNWKDTQQAAITATGKAPPNDLEAAILASVSAGNYTAILSGNGGGTGIGLVEVYKSPL